MNFSNGEEPNIIFTQLNDMREVGHFCDVELVVEGRGFKAHRFVLASNSSHFNTLFNKQKVIEEKITIKNCANPNALDSLLNYMYTGKIIIDWDSVGGLMQLCHEFEVQKVIEFCEVYLRHNINVERCLSVRSLAMRYNLAELEKDISDFLYHNVSGVLKQEEILRFSAKKLKAFVAEQDNVPPTELLKFLCKWVHNSPEKREKCFSEFLESLNWEDVRPALLEDDINDLALLENSKVCRSDLLKCLRKHSIRLSDNAEKLLGKDIEPYNGNELYISDFSMSPDNGPTFDDDSDVSDAVKNCAPSDDEAPIKPVKINKKNSVKHRFPTRKKTSEQRKKVVSDTDSDPDFGAAEPVYDSSTSSENNSDNMRIRLRRKKRGSKRRIKQEEKERHKCDKCSFMTNVKKSFDLHQVIVHSSDKKHKCRNCNFKWLWVGDYENHLKTHFSGPPYKCPECDSFEDELSQFSDHLFTHSDNKSFGCPDCLETFKSPKLVQHHWTTKHANPNASSKYNYVGFSCKKCSFHTSLKRNLEFHTMLTHSTDTTYKCRECDFTWTWIGEYNKHLKVHFKGPPFKCPECKYRDSKLLHFSEHLFTHSETKSFDCPICMISFKSPKQVRRHFNITHGSGVDPDKSGPVRKPRKNANLKRKKLGPKDIKCDKCAFSCRSSERLEQHVFLYHSTETKYKCPECDYRWSLKRDYTIHLKTHYKGPPYKCNHCDYSTEIIHRFLPHTFQHSEDMQFVCDECVMNFKTLGNLQIHRNKYHRPGSLALPNAKERTSERSNYRDTNRVSKKGYKTWSLTCKKCSFVTNNTEMLDQHVSSCKQIEKIYKCYDCDFTTKDNSDLYLHMKIHYDGLPYKCRECDYTTRSMKRLAIHLLKHTDEKFQCVHCNQYYTSHAGLRMHVDRVHPRETPFACDECESTFGNESLLKEHKKHIHSKIEHLCDICGRICKDYRTLWEHRLSHSDKRKKCDFPGCEYKTLFENKLRLHKRKHTGERPFVCTFCCKAFMGRNDLNKHAQIHMNLKFDCHLCNASFGAKYYLTKHMKKYHPDGEPSHKTFQPRKKRLQSFNSNDNNNANSNNNERRKERQIPCPPQQQHHYQNDQMSAHNHPPQSVINNNPHIHQNPIPIMAAHQNTSMDYSSSASNTVQTAFPPLPPPPEQYTTFPAFPQEVPTKFRSFMTFF